MTTTATHIDHCIDRCIDGRLDDRTAQCRSEVYNPVIGQVTGLVALGTATDADAAARAAAEAFETWSVTPTHSRARILFRFRDLMEREADRLAAIITAEHGKVLDDASDEIIRGLEVVESACGIPQQLKGESSRTSPARWTRSPRANRSAWPRASHRSTSR